ncbi:MAG: response regulator transcription factor [Planctomycetota bacterium]
MSKWIPVLVVEDNEAVRKALEYSLKLYGFKVDLAENGPTGLKLARQNKPKLILLDWWKYCLSLSTIRGQSIYPCLC